VTIALACENISQDPAQRLTIHSIIDVLHGAAFPVTTPSIWFVFGFQRTLPGFLMQCKVEILPETGDPIASQVLADIAFKPDQPTARQVVGFGGVIWPKPGVYTIRFSSRGSIIASFSLPLILAKLPGSATS
jgi:hypothetical protein